MFEKKLTKDDIMNMSERELRLFIDDTYEFKEIVDWPEPVIPTRKWRNLYESTYQSYDVIRGLKTLQKFGGLHLVRYIYSAENREKEIKATVERIESDDTLMKICRGGFDTAIYRTEEVKEAYAKIIDKIMDARFVEKDKSETEKILACAIGDKNAKSLADELTDIYFE